MVRVVDGLARKRDLRFNKTRYLIWQNPLVYSGYEIECALLRDWIGRPVDVFLNIGAPAAPFFGAYTRIRKDGRSSLQPRRALHRGASQGDAVQAYFHQAPENADARLYAVVSPPARTTRKF